MSIKTNEALARWAESLVATGALHITDIGSVWAFDPKNSTRVYEVVVCVNNRRTLKLVGNNPPQGLNVSVKVELTTPLNLMTTPSTKSNRDMNMVWPRLR